MVTKPIFEQIALVTGGGTGIGRAFTEVLAAEGVRVVIASRREEMLRRAAAEINSQCGSERVFPYKCDLTVAGEADSLTRWMIGEFGSIDILINNSGLAVPEVAAEITDEGWDTVLDTNLKGAMRLTRAVLPHMLSRDFGDIVNVSSRAGKHGYADVPSYCASKFGLLGFAEALRDDVRKRGANVRVFNFCPGLVDVENVAPGARPRTDAVHVSNMARTLMYALSLDRDVVLEDISLYKR